MGRAQLQAGKSVQCALEDQMGEGDGGFERIADDVGQQAVALEPFREIRDALGMEEDQDAKVLGLGPKRVKLMLGARVSGSSMEHEGRRRSQETGRTTRLESREACL
jgi:hypothetical protein